MGRIFRIDSPFCECMTKLFDLVALNLTFLLSCVPVVTIGAACTALHTVTLKIAGGGEPHAVKGFLQAFKENFKQATMIWLILLAVGGFLYVDTVIAFQLGTGGLPMKCLLGFLGILYLFVLLYIFQIQSRYNNTVRKNLQNALLMAIRQLPKTALLAATVVIPLSLTLYGATSVFLLCIICFLVIGCSLIACIQDKIILKIFKYYEEMGADSFE